MMKSTSTSVSRMLKQETEFIEVEYNIRIPLTALTSFQNIKSSLNFASRLHT